MACSYFSTLMIKKKEKLKWGANLFYTPRHEMNWKVEIEIPLFFTPRGVKEVEGRNWGSSFIQDDMQKEVKS